MKNLKTSKGGQGVTTKTDYQSGATSTGKNNKLPKHVDFIYPYISDRGGRLLKDYPALGKLTGPIVGDIRKLFQKESEAVCGVGQKLANIHQLFCKHIPPTKINSNLGETLFYRFISQEFGLQKTRTNEYIYLSQRQDVNQLKMPISALIELTRLNSSQVKVFLKKNPDLETYSFREIQSLIKDANPNKRKRKKGKAKSRAKSSKVVISNERTAIMQVNALKVGLRSFFAEKKMSSKLKAEIKSLIVWFNSSQEKSQ